MKTTIAERFIESKRKTTAQKLLTTSDSTFVVALLSYGAPRFYQGGSRWSKEAPDAVKFTSLREADKVARGFLATVVKDYGYENELLMADYSKGSQLGS